MSSLNVIMLRQITRFQNFSLTPYYSYVENTMHEILKVAVNSDKYSDKYKYDHK